MVWSSVELTRGNESVELVLLSLMQKILKAKKEKTMSYARIILLLVFHKDWFSNSLTLAL